MAGNYTSTIAGKILQQVAVLLVIMLLSVPPSIADGDMTLTFKVRASRPSCTVTSDKSGLIKIPAVTSSQLTATKDIKDGGATFKLTLKNCTGAGGLLIPKIAMWGNRSMDNAGNMYLFSDSSSTAKNVGFAFRSGSTSYSTGSWIKGVDGTDMTSLSSAKKINVPDNKPGALMNDKSLDFWATVSRDGAPSTAFTVGNLTASMHFDVVFE
ncbi:fimbrial protein [Enterobacter asburiae]|uniref:fimbrial protein n=1 Tax=Enterobacter asburiae TaxID=61645 RepID=UPI0021D08814|nr:fimbrial protein [Enterobacter asburiae]MCU6244085.1 fimbrial protein [Enterobacter asburiae]